VPRGVGLDVILNLSFSEAISTMCVRRVADHAHEVNVGKECFEKDQAYLDQLSRHLKRIK
jgi:hypothetical protein